MLEFTTWVAESAHHQAWEGYRDMGPYHEVFVEPMNPNHFCEEHQSDGCAWGDEAMAVKWLPIPIREFTVGHVAVHRTALAAGGPCAGA